MMKRLVMLASLLLLATVCCRADRAGGGAAGAAGGRAAVNAGGSGAALLVTGFSTPESVRHDPAADVYLVSNINGKPDGHDDNGFISRVSPAGTVLELRWIDGAGGDFTLNAPKGMALKGDTLFVADIDHIRLFDRVSGAHLADWPVAGAHFLNDAAVAADGTLYVTDTGGRTLYRFAGSTPEALASGRAFGSPNGVDTNARGVVVVMWSGGVKRVDPATGEVTDLPAPEGARLDGVVLMDDGSYIVSSWDKEAVLRVGADGRVSEVLGSVPEAADIGYDAARNRILVPTFSGEVHIVPLGG